MRLKKTAVNGKVKSNFRAHEDLLLSVGKHFIREQIRAYFGVNEDGHAMRNVPQAYGTPAMQRQEYNRVFEGFLKHYRYADFSLGEQENPQVQPAPAQLLQQVFRVVRQLPNGMILVAPMQLPVEQPAPRPEEDEIFNYANTLCQWTLQLMQMNDTAREGDITRIMPNLMSNVPFFYSHSALSKYFVECIDYLLKVKEASPQMKIRILEGSFVNTVGGRGKNCEADLKTEHSVGCRKKLIKLLGANKSDSAIARVTNAADCVDDIIGKFDEGVQLHMKSGRHTHSTSEANERVIKQVVSDLKPFNMQPGRKCVGFGNFKFVYEKIDKQKMRAHMVRIVDRLLMGMSVEVDDAEEEEDEHVDEDDGYLPMP